MFLKSVKYIFVCAVHTHIHTHISTVNLLNPKLSEYKTNNHTVPATWAVFHF